MRHILASDLTSFKAIISISLFLLCICHNSPQISAEYKGVTSGCADLLILFARGSGQNQNSNLTDSPLDPEFIDYERESYYFFSWHKELLQTRYPSVSYKAVTIHDFPNKYDPIGYVASPVGLSFFDIQRLRNTANSDVSFIPGEYRASVEHGTAETVGYLKDQISSCKDQTIIIGGYSQGAQVVGDALFQLTDHEKSMISGVGMFGDPKYIGATKKSLINPFGDSESYSWRRGDANSSDTGMLDPRIPYVPDDMESKTTSWCSKLDIVCSGWTGSIPINKSHSNYWSEPIRLTVNEMIELAAPKLAAAERAKGGFTSAPGTTEPVTTESKNKVRDVMFLFNDNSNDSFMQTMRYYLDPVLHPFSKSYNNTFYGAKSFAENDFYGLNIPRVDNIHALQAYTGYWPDDPIRIASTLSQAINTKYPFGKPVIGGGDLADPYQLAIERAVSAGGWRTDTEKNLILVVDRPPKETYQYNICSDLFRQWMHYSVTTGYNNCYLNFITETWQKALNPESCETIFLSITENTCSNPLKSAHYVQNNTRTMADALKVAQAYKVAVSIIIPSKVIESYNPLSTEAGRNRLKEFAYATGGTFIYYDQKTRYDSTSLSDTLHQVFNKPPKTAIITNSASVGNVAKATVGQPVIFDASQSQVNASTYSWDFNDDGTVDATTTSPVTQEIFTTPTNTFVRVRLRDSNQTTISESRIAMTVSHPVNPTADPVAPMIPEISASETADGVVNLTWRSDQAGELLVIDPVSRLPLVSAGLTSGTLVLKGQFQSLEIRVMNDKAVSHSNTVQVTQFIEPITRQPISVPEVITVSDDPTLCYKLQQCTTESNPTATEIAETAPNTDNAPQSANIVSLASEPPAQTVSTAAFSAETEITNPTVAGISNTRQVASMPAVAPIAPISNSKGKLSPYAFLIVLLITTTAGLSIYYNRRQKRY